VIKERLYFEEKYNIGKYEELPFCIVVPTFNNVAFERHIKNMKSIIMQDYTNYHVVFIDDASTDHTGDQVEQFLQQQTRLPPERYVVIKNKEQKRAMPNLRMAAREYCQPQDIFLIVDGDDELIGRQVLKFYSAVFQKEGAWFVYTNFLNVGKGVGYSRPFPLETVRNNKYRAYPFVTSHLRAFYTQLFLNIKEADLQDDQGNYLRAANDVAICIPILEMSHERVKYIPELMYFYNSNTGQNNHKLRLKEQKSNDRMLRKRRKY
jgi:glycosyltransferase involved in cell wall biosynthesis